MPKVKRGNDFFEFPYDPDIVAGLMFRGFEVFPDEGVGGFTKRLHEQEINSRLKKLWGNQNLKSTPGRGEMDAWKNPGNVAPEMTLPHKSRESDFMDVEPNPFLDYPMPKIDPDQLMQRRLTPLQGVTALRRPGMAAGFATRKALA